MSFLVEYEAQIKSSKIDKIISLRGAQLVDTDDIKDVEKVFAEKIKTEKNTYLSYTITSVIPFSSFKTTESLGKSRET